MIRLYFLRFGIILIGAIRIAPIIIVYEYFLLLMNPGRHRPTRTPQNPHLRHLLLLLSRTPQNPHLLLLLLLPNVLAATTATTTTTTTLLLLRPPPPPPLLRRLILLLPLLLHSPLFLLIVVLIVLRPPPPPPSHGPFSSRQHALVTCPSQWPVSASPGHLPGKCSLRPPLRQ